MRLIHVAEFAPEMHGCVGRIWKVRELVYLDSTFSQVHSVANFWYIQAFPSFVLLESKNIELWLFW